MNLAQAGLLFLLLIGTAAAQGPYYINEGEHLILGETYIVDIYAQSISRQGAYILLNNMSAGIAREDEWHTYPDGSQIYIQNIYVTDAGPDSAEIYVIAKSAVRAPERENAVVINASENTTSNVSEHANISVLNILEEGNQSEDAVSEDAQVQVEAPTLLARILSFLSRLFS